MIGAILISISPQCSIKFGWITKFFSRSYDRHNTRALEENRGFLASTRKKDKLISDLLQRTANAWERITKSLSYVENFGL